MQFLKVEFIVGNKLHLISLLHLNGSILGFVFLFFHNPPCSACSFAPTQTADAAQHCAFGKGRKSKTADEIRPEEQESVMLEIYVLKLCVVSFEGALPCRVENALISKKLAPFCQKLLPRGRSLPGGPGNRPIRAWRVADQTWASTARTAPPRSSPAAFVPPPQI